MIIDFLNMESLPRALMVEEVFIIVADVIRLILRLSLFWLRPKNMLINLLFILPIVVFHFEDCVEISKFRIPLKLFLLAHISIGVVKDVILRMKKTLIFVE